jgi:hypothetical protein
VPGQQLRRMVRSAQHRYAACERGSSTRSAARRGTPHATVRCHADTPVPQPIFRPTRADRRTHPLLWASVYHRDSESSMPPSTARAHERVCAEASACAAARQYCASAAAGNRRGIFVPPTRPRRERRHVRPPMRRGSTHMRHAAPRRGALTRQ